MQFESDGQSFFFQSPNKEKVNIIPGFGGGLQLGTNSNSHICVVTRSSPKPWSFTIEFLRKKKSSKSTWRVEVFYRNKRTWKSCMAKNITTWTHSTNEFLNFPPKKDRQVRAKPKRFGGDQSTKKRKTMGQENVSKIPVVSSFGFKAKTNEPLSKTSVSSSTSSLRKENS